MDLLVDKWSLLIQAVNLGIVVAILYFFIFKPYLIYIDEEALKREKLEENARAAEHLISEAGRNATHIVETAKAEARGLVAESEGLAKKEYAMIISDARRDVEQIKAKASKDIENERKMLENAMKDRILSIALRLNEKFFGKKEANAEFIKQAMKEGK